MQTHAWNFSAQKCRYCKICFGQNFEVKLVSFGHSNCKKLMSTVKNIKSILIKKSKKSVWFVFIWFKDSNSLRILRVKMYLPTLPSHITVYSVWVYYMYGWLWSICLERKSKCLLDRTNHCKNVLNKTCLIFYILCYFWRLHLQRATGEGDKHEIFVVCKTPSAANL